MWVDYKFCVTYIVKWILSIDNINRLTVLPRDMLMELLNKLIIIDIRNLSTVNKYMNELCTSEVVKQILKSKIKRILITEPDTYAPDTDKYKDFIFDITDTMYNALVKDPYIRDNGCTYLWGPIYALNEYVFIGCVPHSFWRIGIADITNDASTLYTPFIHNLINDYTNNGHLTYPDKKLIEKIKQMEPRMLWLNGRSHFDTMMNVYLHYDPIYHYIDSIMLV